jgi:hypothetical protein
MDERSGFETIARLGYAPREALGLGGSLRLLQQQPYGWILLAITAAGLMAFGVYQLAEAAYRQVEAPALRQAGAFSPSRP